MDSAAMRSLFSKRSRHPTTPPPPFSGGETPPRCRFPKENVDPSSPAHRPHAADRSPSPFRSPNSAAKPLGTRNRSLPPRPPPSNPLKRKLDVSVAAGAGLAADGAAAASAPDSGVQVVVRIRPQCRVEEEEAGEDGRWPEACVRKTATNSVGIQGQDFTFDAVADASSTQLKNVEGLDGVEEDENYVPAIAIVGRLNVGKSSILNALVGEDRTIVSPVSGTTRDAIDTEFTTVDGQKYKLIDTAGIRCRAVVASAGSTIETLSVKRAFRLIHRCDVVALVIEAMACITEQDYKIAERIEKEGKACVIVVNKWDTIPNKNHQSTTYYEQDVREKLRILDWAPVIYCSATNGSSVEKIISAASLVEKERARRLGTSILNQVIREAVAFKPPPRTRGGKRGRVYYTTQAIWASLRQKIACWAAVRKD